MLSPPLMTRDITSPDHDAIRRFSELDSPTQLHGIQLSFDHSFATDTPSRPSLQRSKRTSDLSTLSLDTAMRTSYVASAHRLPAANHFGHRMDVSWANPRSAGTDDDHSDIFAVQNSIWNGWQFLHLWRATNSDHCFRYDGGSGTGGRCVVIYFFHPGTRTGTQGLRKV